jgi:Transposase IS66 family
LGLCELFACKFNFEDSLESRAVIRTGRLWSYVRDDRPFAGSDPPAAVFFYSRDRSGEHPEQHLPTTPD